MAEESVERSWELGKAWTDEDRATMIRMWSEGAPRKEIALALGRTVSAIQSLGAKLGLTRMELVEGTLRPCMCCRKPFLSEGRWNRLCQPCKDVYE